MKARPKDRDRILTDKREEAIAIEGLYDLYAIGWDSETLPGPHSHVRSPAPPASIGETNLPRETLRKVDVRQSCG